MSQKTDEYEFIKKHWGLEDEAFGQDPRVGWGDIVGIVDAARAAGREEQKLNEKLCACCAINLGEATEEIERARQVGRIEGAREQREKVVKFCEKYCRLDWCGPGGETCCCDFCAVKREAVREQGGKK